MRLSNNFMLAGYHRHAGIPVWMVAVEIDEREAAAMSAGARGLEQAVCAVLGEALPAGTAASDERTHDRRPEDRLAALFVATCIGLQRRIGHRVTRRDVIAGKRPAQSLAWFEYDHPDTAHEVAELAREWLSALLDDDAESRDAFLAELPGCIERLVQSHAHRRMPAETRAIDAAARSRDIPCLRLDRPPCDPIEGDFRLRPHGLLRLGQGWRQHTVDGTFCISRSEAAYPLVRDRRKRFERLLSLGVPLAAAHPESGWCSGAVRAARRARRIGRPVVVRTLQSNPGQAGAERLDGEDAVRRAAEDALVRGGDVLVEPHVEGACWHLPVAGGRAGPIVVRIDPGGGRTLHALDGVDDDLMRRCQAAVGELGVGLAVARIVAPRLDRPLAESGGAVVDIDLEPRLEGLLDAEGPELATLAERFVDWLYPRPGDARIPVLAVTGTNGKTTTGRMLAAIFRQSRSGVGLACSDGSDIDGECLSEQEDGYLPGHLTVLDDPRTRIAVLEATRGGAVSTGQGYDRSVAAACLNVSEDHLNDHLGIRDLDEMAAVKRNIVACAEQAVVLNADDERCLRMAASLDGRRIGLFSLEQAPDRLLGRVPECAAAATIDLVDGVEWLGIHTPSGRLEIARVADIPVCFRGRARHNVANALAAVLLAHFAGEDPSGMARGLQRLGTDFEAQHGRLNLVEGLPFTLVMDYAHNPGGMRWLREFAGRTPVAGRRILNFSCSAANPDAFIRELGRAAAGAFDLYVCKPFTLKYDRELEEVPRLLREGLLEAGVPADSIIVRDEEMDSIRHTLDLARPGDLVVVVGGKMNKRQIWELLTQRAREYRSR